ncbi:MAG TPA: response regulator transcription factor [Lachnospiraceae bacterium]|nr:response regulator transcription factor [Lachnospiraceae bacterium]
MQYRILLVEDDRTIAEEISQYLKTWDFDVKLIADFSAVMEEFGAYDPHLVLMDVSLPFFNGYHWCAQIRQVSQIPVIFLSSANDNMNIVMAMNMGADDFIAKPFDLQVLSAKLQAMLRRSYSYQGKSELLECKGVLLNTSNGTMDVDGQKVELTKNEFRMLQILFSHKGEIVTREAIMNHLWDGDCFVDDNTLAVNMARLRKKLSEYGKEDLITTKKGVGYLVED